MKKKHTRQEKKEISAKHNLKISYQIHNKIQNIFKENPFHSRR